MPDSPDVLSQIDAATLAPILRDSLGLDAQPDDPWHGQPLFGGFGGQGLYQFKGFARTGGNTRAWSMILKVCPPSRDDGYPMDWDAPRREALAYTSGFLAQLPGPLVAPRCLELTDRPDGSAWLWLEDIADDLPGPWNLDRYIIAAHHLGQFNGAFLAGSLPDHSWLSRNWLRRYIAAEGAAAARLEVADDAAPLLRQCFPPPVTVWLRELWTEREKFLTALDRLPQTICHHDAFRRNLFARQKAVNEEQTVAIDWAFTGVGAVGAELAALVVGSMIFFEVSGAAPQELAEATLAGYVAGLRETGWNGDERLARLGFLATAALLYTVGTVRLTVSIVGDPTKYPTFEQAMGRTMAEAVAEWDRILAFELELVEEARRLLPLAL